MTVGPSPQPPVQPYLLRAWHQWCCDAGYTPYIVVVVDDGVQVPREYVKNGEIVLNVGLEATHALVLNNDEVRFTARFGGRPREVIVPCHRVRAIYARETGQGMGFEVADNQATSTADASGSSEAAPPDASPSEGKPTTPAGRAVLKRVK